MPSCGVRGQVGVWGQGKINQIRGPTCSCPTLSPVKVPVPVQKGKKWGVGWEGRRVGKKAEWEFPSLTALSRPYLPSPPSSQIGECLCTTFPISMDELSRVVGVGGRSK